MMPPPFSVLIDGPPKFLRNDPSKSIYFGNGCFWHTQYDFVVVEQDPDGPFRRNDTGVTSLVGYAGGRFESPSGAVCYHGLPHSDYSRLGHAEACSISLDEITGNVAQAQVAALAKMYFEHGFQTLPDGRRQRLDPQDMGAEYRNEDTVALIAPMLVKSGKGYQKFKRAFIRKAGHGEKIQTILQGKIETENIANEGDMVVRADTTSKEEYILKAETFQEFYQTSDPQEIKDHVDAEELKKLGFKAYRPNRQILAIEVDASIAGLFPAGKFMAAWGEAMCLEIGDFLASGKRQADGTVLEIIRIERKSFFETYEAIG
eukprot:symbB.v1.2.015654.t1/scaffold1174.1/size133925/3